MARVCRAVEPCILTSILSLQFEPGLGGFGVDDKVVIAVRAVLVTMYAHHHQQPDHISGCVVPACMYGCPLARSPLLKLFPVLPKALFALFARKDHLHRLLQRVRLLLMVAVCAVEPFPACVGRVVLVDRARPWAVSYRGGDIQQGARMETCTLRMCLLERR